MDTECKDERCRHVEFSVSGVVIGLASVSVLACLCCLCLFCKCRYIRRSDAAGEDEGSDLPEAEQSEAKILGASEAEKDRPGSGEAVAKHNSAVDRCENRDAKLAAENLENAYEGEFKHILELGVMEHWLIPTAHVEVFETAGEGGFGVVRRGLLLGSTEIAVKFNKLDDKSASKCKALINEVQLFRRLRHPNIVLFHGVFVSGEGSQTLGVVLEWVAGGNFGDHCRNRHKTGTYNPGVATPEKLSMIAKDQGLLLDTARGMLYLHALDPIILHRDLKPANILVDTVEPPRAKLTDFGISILMESGKGIKAKAGTNAYMAPEVKRRQFYNTLADVFSFGCVILFLLSGQHPPADDNVLAVARSVTSREHLPGILCRTACSCLQFEPSLRPSFVTIFALLRRKAHEEGNSGTSSTPSDILPADVIGASPAASPAASPPSGVGVSPADVIRASSQSVSL